MEWYTDVMKNAHSMNVQSSGYYNPNDWNDMTEEEQIEEVKAF